MTRSRRKLTRLPHHDRVDWVQTSHGKHAWMKTVDPDDMPEMATLARWYVPRGCRWPLLKISIYDRYLAAETGIKIAVSSKRGKDDWMAETNLPPELIGALIEMLESLG